MSSGRVWSAVAVIATVLAAGFAALAIVTALTGAHARPGVITVTVAPTGPVQPPARAPAPPAAVTGPITTITEPPAPPPPPAQQYGANVNRLFESPAFDAAAVDRQLSALRAAGATIARTDALWEASEPQAPAGGVHRYVWGFDDRIAQDLAEHGLRWLPILDYSAGWAQSVPGDDHSPPASFADYAQYAAAFAARYGPGGTFWTAHPALAPLPVAAVEIWNEPDNPVFWSPHPDPSRYAAMYLQARAAIAAVAPTVRVLVGGLWHPAGFLSAMLSAEPALAGHLDGVSIHPYGTDPEQVVAGVVAARQLLDGLHLSAAPLYVTEFGWTTSPPGARDYLPDRLRPAYLEETLAALGRLDCGIAAITVYTWVTEEQDPGDSEQWYGISPAGGGPGPSSDAFAAGLLAAAGPGHGLSACT